MEAGIEIDVAATIERPEGHLAGPRSTIVIATRQLGSNLSGESMGHLRQSTRHELSNPRKQSHRGVGVVSERGCGGLFVEIIEIVGVLFDERITLDDRA